MIRRILLLTLLCGTARADVWFDGSPEFTDTASRDVAMALLEAHGGMQPMNAAGALRFRFFTKMIGNPQPFYSLESIDLETGDAYLEWPFFNTRMGLDGGTMWSENWPVPLPPGFFSRLTASFVTLPWLIQSDDANIGPVASGRIPNDRTDYTTLRITFDRRSPSIPGTFYDLYIDPESGLMKAVRFDINHPGMVANPNQPLGPNFHVFGDYRRVSGLQIPTYYMSYGTNSAKGGDSNAYHFVWDIALENHFDRGLLEPPAGARTDAVSMEWWQ